MAPGKVEQETRVKAGGKKISVCLPAQRFIPEDITLRSHQCENLSQHTNTHAWVINLSYGRIERKNFMVSFSILTAASLASGSLWYRLSQMFW
jgi:hypothetical protein